MHDHTWPGRWSALGQRLAYPNGGACHWWSRRWAGADAWRWRSWAMISNGFGYNTQWKQYVYIYTHVYMYIYTYIYIYRYRTASPEIIVASESHPKLRRRRLRNASHPACYRRCQRSPILSASWRVWMGLARKTGIELRSQKLMKSFWQTLCYVQIYLYFHLLHPNYPLLHPNYPPAKWFRSSNCPGWSPLWSRSSSCPRLRMMPLRRFAHVWVTHLALLRILAVDKPIYLRRLVYEWCTHWNWKSYFWILGCYCQWT